MNDNTTDLGSRLLTQKISGWCLAMHIASPRPEVAPRTMANFVLYRLEKVQAVNNLGIKTFKTNFYSVVVTEDRVGAGVHAPQRAG